jgi:hypothetical protein
VEVSAPSILSLRSGVDAGAQPGWSEGLFSLDPVNIVLGNFSPGTGSAGAGGVISATGSSGPDVDVDVNTAFQSINANILLQASGNITLNPYTTWDLSLSTRQTAGQLTLEAGGNINLGSGQNGPAAITDENNWSVTLEAGYNFTAGRVNPGSGNVNLGSGCYVETASGDINVLAGNSVTISGAGGIVTGIANGAVIAGPGGNINVLAEAGSVNCGSSTAGYSFSQSGVGYAVNPGLGGIGTASGGNVSIQAGGNIIATLPSGTGSGDAGSGAFGAAPGNVTLTAGGNVLGHYVLANGTGAINCNSAGTSSEAIALSLIKGGWTVNATGNIFLQEVRNPNGMLNGTGSAGGRGGPPGPFRFLFDYDPLAYVVLDAGQGVTITGSGVPRVSGTQEGLIFPPSLTIDAGPGGITLDNSVSLFPSPEGTLNLATTGGGNLNGNTQSILISDSQAVQWSSSKSFTVQDPNNNELLHLNDPNPVLINITGSVSDFALNSPKPVEMFVGGNLTDSSAEIVNLRPTDSSLISVGGELLDHSSFVLLDLPTGVVPNFDALDQVAQPTFPGFNNTVIDNPNLNLTLENQQSQFVYDPASGGLRYSGVMSSAVEQALLSMTTPFLPAALVRQIYTQSQTESGSGIAGYSVAGPGAFRIEAGSIDLGNSEGIVSFGVSGNQALVPYTPRGAALDISSTGNISMIASAIESDYGGDINITSGGKVDVGSVLVPPASDQVIAGIISLWSGNISIIADGNVNVDGSRVAAYDGGNIFVESLRGSVNAGSGNSLTPVLVQKPYVNAQGEVEYTRDEIPGSGILATTYPELVYGAVPGQPGNITVETPQGDIVAAAAGIAQLALGPASHPDATINLDAGSKNSDGTVAYVGNVDASGSGVVGGQVNITATGNVNGLVVASVGANVSALQNVNATVLSQGGASVSAGGTVGGTVVGVLQVSVSRGKEDTALALSGVGVTATGPATGAAIPAAPTASNSNVGAETQNQVTQSTQPNSEVASNDDPELKKKQATNSKLKEYIGRVTVLLPN